MEATDSPDPTELGGDYVFKKKLKVDQGMEHEIELEPEQEKQSSEGLAGLMEEVYSPKKYQILKEIGHGTFGVVFKAKNTESSTTVAIKKTAQDPRNTNREFTILAKIDHPNCLKLISYYFTKEPQSAGPKVPTKLDDEDLPKVQRSSPDEEEPLVDFLNLVTDYYNENLYSIMDFYRKLSKGSSGPKKGLPHALVKLYSYQILRALNYLQQKKIVHRDLKPSNILIDTKSQRLILADLGSAKEVVLVQSERDPSQVTIERSVSYIVSRYYRAPELILGQEYYGYKVDLWSVGCIIAEMFLGHPLFMGKSSQDQLFRIASVLGKIGKLEKGAMNEHYSGPLPEIETDTQLGKILESVGADRYGIDLLTKILVYDPAQRIDPMEAL